MARRAAAAAASLSLRLTRLPREHNASEVYVTGDFDDWKKTVKLEKENGTFKKTVELPKQKHQYKVCALHGLRLRLPQLRIR